MSPTIRTAMLPALALATLALLAPAARAIPPDGLTLNDPSQRAALEVLHRARSTAARTGDPLARRQAVGLLGVRGYVHYARAEARALVADHPDWRPARLLLSDMLARGVDGQLNHAGADRDGAIEVLTALLDEYPDDLGTRKVLASLLGHGIRWRPTTDLAAWARVAELAGDRPAMAWLAGDAALWLGDPEAALAHYARAPEMPWYQTRFAAEAAVHGPDAAIEGMLEVAGPEAVGPLALGTIQTLEMLQRYALARALATRGVARLGLDADVVDSVPSAAFVPVPGPVADPARVFAEAVYYENIAHAAALAERLDPALPGPRGDRAWTLDVAPWPPGEMLAARRNGVDHHLAANPPEVVESHGALAMVGHAEWAPLAVVEQSAGGGRIVAVWPFTAEIFGRRIDEALDAGDASLAAFWYRAAISRFETHFGGTPDDDPFIPEEPLTLAWALGAKTAPGGPDMRLAAAALMAAGGPVDRARATALISARRAAGADARRLAAVELALLPPDERPHHLARLADAAPDDPVLAQARWRHDIPEGDCGPLLARWRDAPESMRAGPEARAFSGDLATRAGRFADGRAHYKAVLAMPDAPAGLRGAAANNLAWTALFGEPSLSDAVALMDRAEGVGEHTRIAVLAVAGRTGEARERWATRVEGQFVVAPDDWLLIGLLAEADGLPDVARDAYRRVEPAALQHANSVARLALRRLAGLGTRP